MYSTAWVNQFEIKDTSIEFTINNVSPQGNNMKIKLNLKIEEICRDFSSIFMRNKAQYTTFSISFMRDTFINP